MVSSCPSLLGRSAKKQMSRGTSCSREWSEKDLKRDGYGAKLIS